MGNLSSYGKNTHYAGLGAKSLLNNIDSIIKSVRGTMDKDQYNQLYDIALALIQVLEEGIADDYSLKDGEQRSAYRVEKDLMHNVRLLIKNESNRSKFNLKPLKNMLSIRRNLVIKGSKSIKVQNRSSANSYSSKQNTLATLAYNNIFSKIRDKEEAKDYSLIAIHSSGIEPMIQCAAQAELKGKGKVRFNSDQMVVLRFSKNRGDTEVKMAVYTRNHMYDWIPDKKLIVFDDTLIGGKSTCHVCEYISRFDKKLRPKEVYFCYLEDGSRKSTSFNHTTDDNKKVTYKFDILGGGSGTLTSGYQPYVIKWRMPK